ncbi:MAG: hypothetical protein HY403_07950 [Elusimicrobia bacterium]|nr:hypothetical protein [Elusimicrobiota bacterium]
MKSLIPIAGIEQRIYLEIPSPIATRIRQFNAAIELGRNGLWLDAKVIMNLMLATGLDGPITR